MMEKACDEAESIEKRAKQQEEVLSEIEEGHESQVSESETNETLSECENQSDEEYEERIFEIDNIIKQAQANVEKFDQEPKTRDLSIENLMGRPESKTESVCSEDSLDGGEKPIFPIDPIPKLPQESQMEASADSLDSKAVSSMNVMTTSADSLEPDTPRSNDKMTMSTDSIENNKGDPMMVSVDSLDGRQIADVGAIVRDVAGAGSLLFTSTDSLESGSNNTRATASMLSSITSQDSETFVADDEFETEDDELRRAQRYLINQGNLKFEDSDESTTCSHSSPLFQVKSEQEADVMKSMADSVIVRSEEVLETQALDEKGNVVTKLKKTTIETKAVKEISGQTEKRDDSCEEAYEEIDEHGNKKLVVVKRSIEQEKK